MHKVGGNYSSCTGRSSENICSSSGGAQEKGKTRCNSSLPPKLVEKLLFRFVKFSFQVTRLMSYYAETGHSRPLIIRQTLQITLLCKKNFGGSLRIKTSHYSNLNKQGRF
jgi:hypothetical protein